MTTPELIRMKPETFTSVLKEMDASSCERHARNIVAMLAGDGGDSFDEYLRATVNVIVTNVMHEQHDIMPYYIEATKFFPNVNADDDILGRLTSLTLLMVTLRLEQDRDRKARTTA